MSLNIKDPEAHRLAHAIAQTTGQSMTRVVTDALRERYAQLKQCRGQASVDEIVAIADRIAAAVRKPYAAHGELLYDERGLPR